MILSCVSRPIFLTPINLSVSTDTALNPHVSQAGNLGHAFHRYGRTSFVRKKIGGRVTMFSY